MATRKPPLEPRVEVLEHEVAQLKRVSRQLSRDQRATSKHLAALSDLVHSILPSVKTELDAQTVAINEHVDEELGKQREFVLSSILDVARQWPAPALVAVTIALTLAVAVAANWLLAAEHLPHIH